MVVMGGGVGGGGGGGRGCCERCRSFSLPLHLFLSFFLSASLPLSLSFSDLPPPLSHLLGELATAVGCSEALRQTYVIWCSTGAGLTTKISPSKPVGLWGHHWTLPCM